MKILFISSHHGTGASETLWIEAAVKLAASGHQVSAAVNWRTSSPERLFPLRQSGISVWLLNLASKTGKLTKLLRRFLPHEKWKLASARQVIKATMPDTIVFSEGNDISALPFMELARGLGIPYQIVTHGVNPAVWPSDDVADHLRPAFTSAVRTYWVAARNIEEFEHHIGTRLGNAEVVHNPVKVDRDIPFAWPTEDGTWRMACVARLQTRAKGHDLLLQAFAAPQWRDRPLHLTFFGDGENRRGLEKLASLLGLDTQISFGGHVSRVQDIWRDHHLIAQPSRNEGMPLSLVEALMCGRPALVTDVAGHAELITDGLNGFIAEAASVQHIGQALERAWDGRTGWQEMGRSAYERIRLDIPCDPAADFVRRILAAASL
jgi:glycosyltransferase involved in cell wall biosynthesis